MLERHGILKDMLLSSGVQEAGTQCRVCGKGRRFLGLLLFLSSVELMADISQQLFLAHFWFLCYQLPCRASLHCGTAPPTIMTSLGIEGHTGTRVMSIVKLLPVTKSVTKSNAIMEGKPVYLMQQLYYLNNHGHVNSSEFMLSSTVCHLSTQSVNCELQKISSNTSQKVMLDSEPKQSSAYSFLVKQKLEVCYPVHFALTSLCQEFKKISQTGITLNWVFILCYVV